MDRIIDHHIEHFTHFVAAGPVLSESGQLVL
jgi:hypothetical protein